MKNPDFGGLITAGSEIQSDYYIPLKKLRDRRWKFMDYEFRKKNSKN